MDGDHWIRPLLGAAATLLAALLTALARALLKTGEPRRRNRRRSDSSDVFTVKIERRTKTR